jgi:ribose 5-phosphate isomerase B
VMNKDMHVGIAADHGGFELKEKLGDVLEQAGYPLTDFGAASLDPADDYPRFVIPLARAVAAHEVERGIAICGSGVGACVAANKIAGIRAALIADTFSARQGVEDDNMNLICMGGRVLGFSLALELVQAYLGAEFIGAERHRRRLSMIEALEAGGEG